MRVYEMMILIKSDLTQEDKDSFLKKYRDIVAKHEGNVDSLEVWAENRPLSYPIHSRGATRKNYDHATYLLSLFSLPETNLGKLNFDLNLVEEILRWLIIKKEVK